SGQSYLSPLLCITKYLTTERRPHIMCVMVAPRPLHDRALDNLRFIRQTMEPAGSFTAGPGWGQVAVGVTALAAAFLAARQPTPELWLSTWLGEAIVALAIGGSAMVREAYAVNDPILSGPGRRFGLSFLPHMIVGGLLTGVLYRARLWTPLPAPVLPHDGTGFVGRRARAADPRARAPRHRERAGRQRVVELQPAQGPAQDDGRQFERARAPARGGTVHHLHEVVRGADPEDRVSAHRCRAA